MSTEAEQGRNLFRFGGAHRFPAIVGLQTAIQLSQALTRNLRAGGTHTYRAFGLNISSELQCDGLEEHTGHADVFIRMGEVPEQLATVSQEGVLYQVNPSQLLLRVPGLAGCLVSNGSEIILDPVPGAQAGAVRSLLFGSAFGALLHQRSILALHASAILTSKGAVVFAGPSGSGKSTLAAAFHCRSFPVLADEISGITTTGELTLWPAYPSLMLWSDAVDRLKLFRRSLQPLRRELAKYFFPLEEGFAGRPAPVKAIYILEIPDSGEFRLTSLQGIRKIEALSRNIYRPAFARGMNLTRPHLRQIGEIARRVRVTSVTRPSGGFRIEELADLLANDFAA